MHITIVFKATDWKLKVLILFTCALAKINEMIYFYIMFKNEILALRVFSFTMQLANYFKSKTLHGS